MLLSVSNAVFAEQRRRLGVRLDPDGAGQGVDPLLRVVADAEAVPDQRHVDVGEQRRLGLEDRRRHPGHLLLERALAVGRRSTVANVATARTAVTMTAAMRIS